MGVEIISDKKGAVFVCNTSEESFGPTIKSERSSDKSNRELAKNVLKEVEKRTGRDIRKVYREDPEFIENVYHELKLGD